MNVLVLDNSIENSGIYHYGISLYENLKEIRNTDYLNIYDNIKHHYYLYSLYHSIIPKFNYDYELGIYINSFAKTQKFKKEILIVHDTFLWDYGKYKEKLIFFLTNKRKKPDRIFISETTKNKYGGEGKVIHPFIRHEFWDVQHEGKGNFILTDYGNYPNKDIKYYEMIYRNNDLKFKHFGSNIQYPNVEDVKGNYQLVAQTYANAGLLLFLSNEEGFGYPLAQAGISGLPVITKDIPVVKEIYGRNKYYDSDLIDDKGKINKEIMDDIIQDTFFLKSKQKMMREKLDSQKLLNEWKETIKNL